MFNKIYLLVLSLFLFSCSEGIQEIRTDSLDNRYEITFNVYEDFLSLYNIELNAFESIRTFKIGAFNSYALTSEGRLFTVGRNNFGQLGNGNFVDQSTPIDITSNLKLEEGEHIRDFYTGGIHSAVITSKNRLIMWGHNSSGQIGNGTTEVQPEPFDISGNLSLRNNELIEFVSLAASSSFVLTSNNRVIAWGDNRYGQLGDGTKIDRLIPLEITSFFSLESNERVNYLSTTHGRSFASSSLGRTFIWGDTGPIGWGETEFEGGDPSSFQLTPIDITSMFGLETDEIIKSVATSFYHSIAITSNERVFSWCSINWTCDGTVKISNTPVEITPFFDLLEGERIRFVSVGSYHSTALTSEGRVIVWGSNRFGQLGFGSVRELIEPVDVNNRFDLNVGEEIVSFSLADTRSTAITSEGRVFGWGNDREGYLSRVTTNKNIPFLLTDKESRITFTETARFSFDQNIVEPTTANKIGYYFDGWYIDNSFTTRYEFIKMPARDLTLYGRWLKNN